MKKSMSREAGSGSAGKKIVIIGGGTGTSTVIQGLKEYPASLSVIVSSADDGGSTGELRKKLGVFPPGDIRQCLAALAKRDFVAKYFNHRFESGPFRGHTAGNLILAGLELQYKNISKAIEAAAALVNSQGSVIPVTLKPTTLSATYDNGKVVVGEHNIDEPAFTKASSGLRPRISNLSLTPKLSANPKAIKAIREAETIVFGPGDLYTSILPNILVKAMAEAVNKSAAKKIFIIPIMSKPGQTDGFAASDYVNELHKYLKGKIDTAVLNTGQPAKKLLNKYIKHRADLVENDENKLLEMGINSQKADLISPQTLKKSKSDTVYRSVLRHDSEKTGKIIWQLIK